MAVNNGHVRGMLGAKTSKAALEALLGLQIHVGAPMKIQFRNLLPKKL